MFKTTCRKIFGNQIKITNITNVRSKFIISISRDFTSVSTKISKSTDTEIPSLNSSENNVIINKLREKDITYFSDLLNRKGAFNVLQKLENIASLADINSKMGRELITAKNEIVTRLVYQERSIEEHENVSNHICETELYKVYSEHLKQLNERLENVDYLRSKSTDDSHLIYEYKGSQLCSKYFLSPFLIFSIPSLLTFKYKFILSHALGALSPYILLSGFLYASLKRHKWLTAGSKIQGAKLVTSLRLTESSLIVVSGRGSTTLNLTSTKIQLVENDVRRDSYYIMKDSMNHNAFIMPIDGKAIFDHKALNMISTFKSTYDKYDIKNVLALGSHKLIDINKNKTIRNELDIVARINMLSSRQIELTNLTYEGLYDVLYSIPDSEVNQYLENVKNGITSVPEDGLNFAAVENLITSFGINRQEAIAMTVSLKKRYAIGSFSEVAYLNKDELKDSFYESVIESEVKFENFYTSIQVFFESLNKK